MPCGVQGPSSGIREELSGPRGKMQGPGDGNASGRSPQGNLPEMQLVAQFSPHGDPTVPPVRQAAGLDDVDQVDTTQRD